MLSNSLILPDEAKRLEALYETGLWKSGYSSEFDSIAELAAEVLDCPIALISLVGQDELWFKAKVGLDVTGTSREVAFCGHAIAGHEPLIVEDARCDERFVNHPLTVGDVKLAFYAGVPISLDDENNLGTLCVFDREPRQLNEAQVTQLSKLAHVAEGLIRAFKTNVTLLEARKQEKAKSEEFERTAFLLKQIKDLTGVGGWEFKLDPPKLTWTEETKRIHEVPNDYEPELDTAIEFYAPEVRPSINAAFDDALNKGSNWDRELPFITARGNRKWVRALGSPVYEEGVLVGIIGAFQDITETKLNEERMRTSEKIARKRSNELATILDNMDEGVSVFGQDGRLTVWNQRYIEIFEKPAGEVERGVTFRSLLEHEQARGEFEGDIDEHIRDLEEKLKNNMAVSVRVRTRSGRIINANHAPLPEGGWVGTHSDVTSEALAAERNKYASLHDPLTGLPNRLAFNAELDRIRNCAVHENDAIVLMLVDLDKFKNINDSHGHQAGDELLVNATKRLRRSVRENDLVARLGGDEFAILMVCPQTKAREISEAIASEITEIISRPFDILGKKLNIGASIGLRIADINGVDIDKLISEADQALYKVKESCRGSYCFFDSNIAAEQKIKAEVARAVKSSDMEQSLALYFQPVYELQTLKSVGAEALVRWKDKAYDSLTANEIVRVAEENRAIVNLGNWVLKESIRTARQWASDQIVSVNVSPNQLGTGTLYEQILWILDEQEFPAHRLELEITENVFLKEAPEIMAELSKIQSLGVEIAIDDFGNGFASLGYLQRFAFDRIKIARSVLPVNASDTQSIAIMRSIANLASELGISTTAEGIETEEQLRYVKEVGCTWGQGFYLGKPTAACKMLGHQSALAKAS